MTLSSPTLADLVILVPDKQMESAVAALLARPKALGVRRVTYRIYVHIERDPGCYRHCHDFLRPMSRTHAHALVMFDRRGSGREHMSRQQIEGVVESALSANGWEDRAAAIVVDPELETWVWSDSPQVGVCLGCHQGRDELRKWLRNEGLWPDGAQKPPEPKRAMEEVLRHTRTPRSAAIYSQLAAKVSLEHCLDPAFLKFKRTMRAWFPPST